MWDGIAGGWGAFAEAACLGALLSLFYDVFRVRRALLPLPSVVVFVEDVFYCLTAAASFFLVLMDVGNGGVRWFMVLGVACGWLVCHFTVGLVVITAARVIVRCIRLVLYVLLRYLVRPVWLGIRKGVSKTGGLLKKNKKQADESYEKKLAKSTVHGV